MKRFGTSIILTGALALGSAVLPAATANWQEELHRAKTGRYTPVEENRRNAAIPVTAPKARLSLGVPTEKTAAPNTWREELLRAKTGRYSPAEEKRLAEIARLTPATSGTGAVGNNWLVELFKAKTGRELVRQR